MPLRRLHTMQLKQLQRWIREGLFQEELAKRLNVSQILVCQAWNLFLGSGSADYTHGGREQNTTQAQYLLIILIARRYPTYVISRINSFFRQAGLVISG